MSTDEIEGYLKRQLVSAFSQAAGRSDIRVMDMAANYGVLATAVQQQIAEEFKKLGIDLTTFIIENISLPPEVEKAIDAAAAQSARGVDNTMAWEGIQAMRDAARQQGGAGAGVMNAGLGMGMGMGHMMGNVMGQAMPGYGVPPGYPPPQHAPVHPAAPAAGTPAEGSLEDKLRKLKAAFEADLLTEDEYKTKRAQLLENF